MPVSREYQPSKRKKVMPKAPNRAGSRSRPSSLTTFHATYAATKIRKTITTGTIPTSPPPVGSSEESA